MRNLLMLFVLTFGLQAQAHFQLGVYEGNFMDSERKCSFEILGVSFFRNIRHPLNERVSMRVDFIDSRSIIASHTPVVDMENAEIGFQHGVLTAAHGIAMGTEAFELRMNEQGPLKMSYLRRSKGGMPDMLAVCENLNYMGPGEE